jgi:hypothetical protein
MLVFCENREKRRRGKDKKIQGRKRLPLFSITLPENNYVNYEESGIFSFE